MTSTPRPIAAGSNRADDATRFDRFVALAYSELHALAEAQFRGEAAGHTLQPTALVHEAFLRLSDLRAIEWRDRTHFLSAAAGTMRRILIEHARRRTAQKRGEGVRPRLLLDVDAEFESGALELIEIDDALQRLEKVDPRSARVVELRWFAGLTVDETADALDVSARTVKGDWRFARAWLRRHLDP
jgi:RNA polymerase sigma factor (TIGR02999 family)